MKARIFVCVMLLTLGASIPVQGVTRVPRSTYVFGVNAGWSGPFGDYTAIGPYPVNDYRSVSASDLFNSSYSLGMDLGQLRNDRLYTGLGIRYTKVDMDPLNVWVPRDVHFHQFDMNLDLIFYPVSPVEESVSPYFGPGVGFGFTTQSVRGYRSESQFTVSLNLNFGLDFRVWKATDGRALMTLSSINSVNVMSTGDRPKFVNIGAGLKYFFRP